MKTNVAFLLCLLLTFTLSAQKAPIKWGKVSRADLNMKTYDLDPEADAVVLTDYASLRFDFSTDDILYEFDHHVRIKILKKSAFDHGDISIPYYSKDKLEKISSLKAQVILPNGKKIEVKKKDVYNERINDYWSQRKFAFPGLEEGCIIEYKYSKKSQLIYFLEDWYFQTDIPTRLSEFRTNIPEWFKYVSFSQGLSHKVEASASHNQMPFSMQRESRTGLAQGRRSVGNNIEVEVTNTRYYLEKYTGIKTGEIYHHNERLLFKTFPSTPICRIPQ